MKVAVASLKSIGAYTQGKRVWADKENKESADAFEKRTWKQRAHISEDTGTAFIPAISFKLCIAEGAKHANIQIKGQGKATYTKNFVRGVTVLSNLDLGVPEKDLKGVTLDVPADGTRGGSKRVTRTFPIFPEWKGDVEFYILDDIITEDIFAEVLRQSGLFIGIGTWRPQNNGENGRFAVEKIKWTEKK